LAEPVTHTSLFISSSTSLIKQSLSILKGGLLSLLEILTVFFSNFRGPRRPNRIESSELRE
jgi:hypothetical protein